MKKLTRSQWKTIASYAGAATKLEANSVAKFQKSASAKTEKMAKVTLKRSQWEKLEKKAKMILAYIPSHLTEDQYEADQRDVFKTYLEDEVYDENTSEFEDNINSPYTFAPPHKSERPALINAIRTYFTAINMLHKCRKIPETVRAINFPPPPAITDDSEGILEAIATNGAWDAQILSVLKTLMNSSIDLGELGTDVRNIDDVIDVLSNEKADAIEKLVPWQRILDPNIEVDYPDPQDYM